jgi:integrase
LTAVRQEQFLAARRAAGYRTWISSRSLRVPLAYLREIGIAPASAPAVADGPVARLLCDYRGYLVCERGLAPKTVDIFERVARLFLAEREDGSGLALERLSAADVSMFLARECPKRSIPAAQQLVTGLRALLRYLHVAGVIDVPLRWAVPGVADRRGLTLPLGLEPAAVAKLLASCDRRRTVGRRDYAVLLLLARLGLRASEVAAIQLDDLDWRGGELLVRGKGNRHERLPLSTDVGEALVSYLRRRPRSECRRLFLCVRAPRGAVDGSVVSQIVRAACTRAGLPRVGAHRLRHTAATGMLRAGASLPEIAQVLRHQRLQTTAGIREGRSSGAAWIGAAVAGGCDMSPLREALLDYLQIRCSLGFKLESDGRMLEDFIGFLEQAGATRVTTELALRWAKLPQRARPYHWRKRLGVVRLFAQYLVTIDPQTEVPSKDLLPATRQRPAPYIYTPAEIATLMRAARALRPPLRASTFETLIGLMAATGLRLGEALGLDRGDVDLGDGALRVRGKQDKQREVPLHDSTVLPLRKYVDLRDRRWPEANTAAFFLSRLGVRLTVAAVHNTFPQLIRQAGLEGRGHRARPRPHDLRHTMAVGTLLDWHRAGVEVDRQLPLLTTYLGHQDPSNTYWYLQATPELMALIAQRLDGLGQRS